MRWFWLANLFAALFVAPGCYRAQVNSGLPPGDSAHDYDFRWKHAFVLGLVDGEARLELAQLCPQGWSQLIEQNDLLTMVSTVGSFGMYTPRRLTVICAEFTESPIPPPRGYPSSRARDVYPPLDWGSPPPPPPPLRP